MIIIAPLGNIDCTNEIILHKNIKIECTPLYFEPIIKNAIDKFIIRHPIPFNNLLIIRKIEFDLSSRSPVKEFLEEVILLLRIYKPGSVFFNYFIVDLDNWYDNPQKDIAPHLREMGVFFYMGWGHTGIETKYFLENSDQIDVQNLVSKNINKNLMNQEAYKHFFRGFHQPYSDDRFLNNAIALENILVNDSKEQSNIRYKFIDRGCFMLQLALPNPEGANFYVKSLKNIYDARCQLVHSTKSSINWKQESSQELLKSSENYLRILLRYLLDHPELNMSTNIDNLKREKY